LEKPKYFPISVKERQSHARIFGWNEIQNYSGDGNAHVYLPTNNISKIHLMGSPECLRKSQTGVIFISDPLDIEYFPNQDKAKFRHPSLWFFPLLKMKSTQILIMNADGDSESESMCASDGSMTDQS